MVPIMLPHDVNFAQLVVSQPLKHQHRVKHAQQEGILLLLVAVNVHYVHQVKVLHLLV